MEAKVYSVDPPSKREFTAQDRKTMFMSLFAMGEQQAEMLESGSVGPIDKNEHFGMKVGRKFKYHYNGLMQVLRERFDALLEMFLVCPEAQDFIQGRIMVWKVTKQANAKRTVIKVDVEAS